MFQRIHTATWLIVLALVLYAGTALAADAPKVESKSERTEAGQAEETKIITPEEAKDYLDKTVTVEFTVVSSRELLDKNIGFLNSERDLKSKTNFTAFFKNMKKFKEASKIEKPADHFLKKKVRVTGKIIKYREKFEIEIESPEQIKIVEENESETAKSSPA
jgi:DNA/RNA endonuclease YhcR with UshA esterase domain